MTDFATLEDLHPLLQEIQRLRKTAELDKAAHIRKNEYIDRLRAALRRIKVIGDESHENDAHCCAHEAEQALEQECEPESLQQEAR